MVPTAILHSEIEDSTELFADELELDEPYRGFDYYSNPKRKEEGDTRALIFQGRYMNGYGYKYFQNAFGEYILVHD